MTGPNRKLVHGWPSVDRDNGLWSRWAITFSTVSSFGFVVGPPVFDDDPGFSQCVENLPCQQFVPHAPAETLAVPPCARDPDAMKAGLDPTALIQTLTASAMKSERRRVRVMTMLALAMRGCPVRLDRQCPWPSSAALSWRARRNSRHRGIPQKS